MVPQVPSRLDKPREGNTCHRPSRLFFTYSAIHTSKLQFVQENNPDHLTSVLRSRARIPRASDNALPALVAAASEHAACRFLRILRSDDSQQKYPRRFLPRRRAAVSGPLL